MEIFGSYIYLYGKNPDSSIETSDETAEIILYTTPFKEHNNPISSLEGLFISEKEVSNAARAPYLHFNRKIMKEFEEDYGGKFLTFEDINK